MIFLKNLNIFSSFVRYTPAYTPLAIQELDEKHLGTFSFRTREGLLQVRERRRTFICLTLHVRRLAVVLEISFKKREVMFKAS